MFIQFLKNLYLILKKKDDLLRFFCSKPAVDYIINPVNAKKKILRKPMFPTRQFCVGKKRRLKHNQLSAAISYLIVELDHLMIL